MWLALTDMLNGKWHWWQLRRYMCTCSRWFISAVACWSVPNIHVPTDLYTLNDIAPNGWEKMQLHELTQSMRQKDMKFVNCLNKICTTVPLEGSEEDRMFFFTLVHLWVWVLLGAILFPCVIDSLERENLISYIYISEWEMFIFKWW